MRIARAAATIATLALTGALSVAAPASANNIGTTEGCTPGYWKNHTASWVEGPRATIPTTRLMSRMFPATTGTSFASVTALEALQGGGGKGVDGATSILLRAATASWLNSAHEELDYPLRRHTPVTGTVARVDAALLSRDRERMLTLADELDRFNNLGCPLS